MYWPTLSGGLVRYPEKNFTVKKYLILLNAFLGLSLVFYAGQAGLPLSINEESPSH
jgi:hypothetical protein